MTTLTRLPVPSFYRSAVLLAMLILTSVAATGATVYKSVDADGTVRYSDKPPQGNDPVEKIHLPDRVPVTLPDTESLLAQMAATTERLKADRLEREAARQPRSPPAVTRDYPQSEPQRQYWPYPWLQGQDGPAYGEHRNRQRHDRPAPNLRNDRDRRRADREGTWYVPKRLPDLDRSGR